MIIEIVSAPKKGALEKTGFRISSIENLNFGLKTEEKSIGQCPVFNGKLPNESSLLTRFQLGLTQC